MLRKKKERKKVFSLICKRSNCKKKYKANPRTDKVCVENQNHVLRDRKLAITEQSQDRLGNLKVLPK